MHRTDPSESMRLLQIPTVITVFGVPAPTLLQVRDCNLFSFADVTSSMQCAMILLTVPRLMRISITAVIDFGQIPEDTYLIRIFVVEARGPACCGNSMSSYSSEVVALALLVCQITDSTQVLRRSSDFLSPIEVDPRCSAGACRCREWSWWCTMVSRIGCGFLVEWLWLL